MLLMKMKVTALSLRLPGRLSGGAPWFFLNAGLLLLVMALPSRMTTWFDGLPWTGGAETVLMMILMPVLLILGWRFLFRKRVCIGLLVLVVLKLVLAFGAPAEGWRGKGYPSEIDYERGAWIETYTTLWQADASGLLLRPWRDKRDFPLEWGGVLMGERIWASRFAATFVQEKPGSKPQYNHIRPVLEFSESVIFHEPSELVIVADGVIKGSLKLTNSSGQRIPIRLLTTGQALNSSNEKKIVGKWNVSGALVYSGDSWTLKPILVTENGSVKSVFDSNTLFRVEDKDLSSSGSVRLFRLLSDGFSLCLAVFIIIWIIWLCRELIERSVLLWPLVFFSGLGLLLPFFSGPILEALVVDRGGVNLGGAPLGLALLISGGGLLVAVSLWSSAQRVVESNVALVVFLLFGPAMFAFYAFQWWSGLDRVPDLTIGDDWTSYQLFAFRIAAWGEVLSGGVDTPLFYFQPFYRYVVALFHWLFGKSIVPQQLFDVWCVLGAAVILASFVRRYAVSNQNALLVSILYIVPVLMGPLRHHVGRGLSENTGMIFLLLAAWLLARNDQKHWSQILLAGIVGVLGYWTRQDHLLVLAALVCLWIEPVSGTTTRVWSAYKARILGQWRPISVYLFILACGVLAILLRHWLLADQFVLGPTPHPALPTDASGHKLIFWQPIDFFYRLQEILAMKPTGELPSPFAIAMMVGALFGVLALVWRPNVLQMVPVAIGLMLVAALVPYYFFRIGAYPPRYSIHVLPIATMSFVFVWDRWVKMIGRRDKFPIAIKISRLFGGVSSDDQYQK